MPILKILILVFTIFVTQTILAQLNNNYIVSWDKVAALEKKGLTKSANQEVLHLFNLAQQNNNAPQQIKTILYLVKYRNQVQENSPENNIFFIDSLCTKAKTPTLQILQSIEAEMYWQYLQNNRYKLYNRTALANDKSKDVSTWSLEKLHQAASSLYLASLINKPLLKTIRIQNFEAIISKGENTRQLRPTLFDFLAFRALDYFINDEQNISQAADHFEIKDTIAFAPVEKFITSTFTTKDSSSLFYTALILFKDILQLHLKDTIPDALLDADLQRLNFVYRHAVNENKTPLYEAALNNLANHYPDNPAAAQALYLSAQIYYDRGASFDPLTTTTNQYEIKRARELCMLAVQKFPNTQGGINAKNLIYIIDQPVLNLLSEEVNLPGQAFRTLVKYKNVKTIYCRLIKISKAALQQIETFNNDQLWKETIALKPIKTWSIDLPDPKDFQPHSTEIKIDALTNGLYIILASIDESFSLQKNVISKQVTQISNLSYINNNNNYYVLNRDNGQPINNALVQVWETSYNYNNSKNETVKSEKYTTDTNGFFKLKNKKNNSTIQLQIVLGNDELFLDNNIYRSYFNDLEAPVPALKPASFLFTDRVIYRPGQTIFFKGIVIQKDATAAKSILLNAFKTVIQLKDANNQKLQEVSLTTNEYGSYHGALKLPESVLNGSFSIVDSLTNTVQYFTVEAYKRPKFFVTLKQPTVGYRLMDSIPITGVANAYAGNVINGAKVNYRVVRKIRYPIWWSQGYGGKIMPPGRLGNEVEITNGETFTNEEGYFTINFKALPDETVDENIQPVFYYETSAAVTDINGETREAITSVAVAYQMLQLQINTPKKTSVDSLKSIRIICTNLNDVEVPAAVNLTIEKLQSPGKFFRERYWPQPDQYLMSQTEYFANFPEDVYRDENEISHYPIAEKLLDKTDSTNKPWLIAKPFKAGWYKLTATAKDNYGKLVTAITYLQLYDNDNNSATTAAISFYADKKTAVPGEQINYRISTGFKNIWLIQNISKMDNTDNISYQSISYKKWYNNSIDIQEKDRGGIAIDYIFVQHNRVYRGSEILAIPWSNKNLNIAYSSFRDKLLPGSNIQLTLKITGSKSEKVSSEILAAMYDASLDQFKIHQWPAIDIWPTLSNINNFTPNGFTIKYALQFTNKPIIFDKQLIKTYDKLLFSPQYLDRLMDLGYGAKRKNTIATAETEISQVMDNELSTTSDIVKFTAPKIVDNEARLPKSFGVTHGAINAPFTVRKNFAETAFFFPELHTDSTGSINFSFTIPEALTEWKLMVLAHSKSLATAYSEKKIITQKPLMVQPNTPRFLREGDRIELNSKLVNLSDQEITGTVLLELIDATTNKPVDGWFKNIFATQYFTVTAGQSSLVKFPVTVPFNFNSAITFRVTAQTTNGNVASGITHFSDGEEMTIPVLTNRILVTESLPINMRNQTTKKFSFQKLLNSDSSETLTNHALTVEFSSNPIWYAVQALPYLMEAPCECADQFFNRYYANTIASFISNKYPTIKSVFNKWSDTAKGKDSVALLSNLQKNEDLKTALLLETPWVLEAKNETQQKQNIAVLFNMVKISAEAGKAIQQLKEMQSVNGGFVWFKGGPDDRYITQYILTGIGHLKKLGALTAANSAQQNNLTIVINKAIPYLDKKIQKDYEDLIKNKIKLINNNLTHTAIQYLYLRSFFTEIPVALGTQTAYTYYISQAKKYWLNNNKYLQAMIALTLHRNQDNITPKAIMRSLKENSINSETLGMYWKEWTVGGYRWQQAPIESQVLMIEAFTDIDKNNTTINDLKTWLLQQKQTQNWMTTRATAEACYALLLNSGNWLTAEKAVTITLGDISIRDFDSTAEAGTGYFKKVIDREKVNAAMGNIGVSVTTTKTDKTNRNNSNAWGAVYWQYFEDLDKTTTAVTPLQLNKKLFVEKKSNTGPLLVEVADGATLKIGDKVKVRILLKVDRDMEYIHMKDLRAACMEPIDILSAYKYQDGLGYYETTQDASTSFFFSRLPKGNYVFEYPLFVTHTGNFSNGITTIQSNYAPAFSSHSEGIRITVE